MLKYVKNVGNSTVDFLKTKIYNFQKYLKIFKSLI